jgi:hypothetical protein
VLHILLPPLLYSGTFIMYIVLCHVCIIILLPQLLHLHYPLFTTIVIYSLLLHIALQNHHLLLFYSRIATPILYLMMFTYICFPCWYYKVSIDCRHLLTSGHVYMSFAVHLAGQLLSLHMPMYIVLRLLIL